MHIKILNIHKNRLVYKVDGQCVKIASNTYTDIPLAVGKHRLEVIRKTMYNSPLCYFVVLNPLFFIWQIRFLEHRGLPKNRFSLVRVEFEVQDAENTTLFLVVKQNLNEIECTQKEGIKNCVVHKPTPDTVQWRRCKKTHICSSVLYMLVFNILGIIDGILEAQVWSTILFCVLISLFSIYVFL